MQPILRHLRRQAVGYTALVIALGGTSYAAVSLPAGSVGTPQLRNGSVTPPKLNARSIGGHVLAWAHVSATGQVLSGSRGAVAGTTEGALPNYGVAWRGVKLPGRCVPMVTLGLGGSDGAWPIAKVDLTPQSGFIHGVKVHGSLTLEIADSSGQAVPDSFNVAVVC